MSEIKFKDKALWVLEEPIALQPEETQTIILPTSVKTAAKALTITQKILKKQTKKMILQNLQEEDGLHIEVRRNELKEELEGIEYALQRYYESD